MNQTYYLGIDGGASKTELVLADQFGQVVDQTEVGPTSLVALTEAEAKANLTQGLRKLIKPGFKIQMAVMGLASLDTAQEEEQAAQIFQPIFSQFKIEQFSLVNDIMVALVNATDRDNAVILLAGTGSNCYGQNDQGQTAKTSGLDYLLSDQGSGYSLGLQALKVAGKSFDGRMEKSLLEELICKQFGVKQVLELKERIYRPNLNKTQVAQLASLVFQAATKQDQAAQALIQETVEELWLMADRVIEKLGLEKKSFDLVLAGSVAQKPEIIKEIQQCLQADHAQANLILPRETAVFGALKLAML